MRQKFRKLRRRKHKSLIRNTIIVMALSTLLLATGYSAFSTNITLNAKGNIKEKEYTVNDLKEQVVILGDGLYLDSVENNRYVYRGKNPNNYMTFNNDVWRIISIESDNSIKIVKEESIGSYSYDKASYRNNANNTYCTSTDGCNEWGINESVNGNSSLGYTTQKSSLNDYLNNEYFNSISNSDKNYMVKSRFKVGRVYLGQNNTQLSVSVGQASNTIEETWIGLINSYDYVTTSLNEQCINIYYANQDNGYCKEDNYLYKDYNQWTLNGTSVTNRSWMWSIENGIIKVLDACNEREVKPALYLKSDIKLIGKGTELKPYRIVTN